MAMFCYPRLLVLGVFINTIILGIEAGDEKDTTVLILGAGLSGIAAAKTLHDKGIDFIILEGDDDIGGRVKSLNFGGITIDTGANWIHFGNKSTNPIWQLKEKYDVQGRHSDYDDLVIFDGEGNDVTDEADIFWEQYEEATDNDRFDEMLSNMKLGIIPDMSVRSALKIGGWFPRTPLAKVVEYFEHDAEFAERPGVTSFRSTRQVSNELSEGGGDFFVVDPRGFDVIVKGLANEFLSRNDDRLKLNHVVKEINWNDHNVSVTTKDGKQFTADFAICTFSIGVLVNEVVDFVPELPYWKTEEINQFHMAWFTKLYLKFAEDVDQFWPEEEWMLYADERRGFYPVWSNLEATGFLPDSANTMLIIITGEESKRIEAQPTEETTAELMAVLRRLFGDDIPDPVDVFISNWGTNPLYYGAYSNWPVEVSMASFERLQAAVGNLYFAGEGTHERYNGYLQGALLSGQDRAEDVYECINGNCKTYVYKESKYGCMYEEASNFDPLATKDSGGCEFPQF